MRGHVVVELWTPHPFTVVCAGLLWREAGQLVWHTDGSEFRVDLVKEAYQAVEHIQALATGLKIQLDTVELAVRAHDVTIRLLCGNQFSAFFGHVRAHGWIRYVDLGPIGIEPGKHLEMTVVPVFPPLQRVEKVDDVRHPADQLSTGVH